MCKTSALKTMNKDGGLRLLDCKTYYKAIIIKNVCYRNKDKYKNKYREQWNRMRFINGPARICSVVFY